MLTCYYCLRMTNLKKSNKGVGSSDIVNSGGLGNRSDGATPICNRRAIEDDVTNFSSIDYSKR
ncbi:MAG: palindromic element RPE2 domain-containing protein [Candidatus Tisiphia sp.]